MITITEKNMCSLSFLAFLATFLFYSSQFFCSILYLPVENTGKKEKDEDQDSDWESTSLFG